MSRQTFLNRIEDMAWLKDVHGVEAQAAIIVGNEDCPERVEAFDVRHPTIDRPSITYSRDPATGKLTRAS